MRGVPPSLNVAGGLLLGEQQAGVGGVAGYELTGAISGIAKSIRCAAYGIAAVVSYYGATIAEPGCYRADCLLIGITDIIFLQSHVSSSHILQWPLKI